MEDVKSMKENGPSECSIVYEASIILNEDRANGASETSENISGKMSHEMQASDSSKVEHDGGYLEEDQPSPSGNLISTFSKTGKAFETESPQNSAPLELEALLPLTENPEPLERRRDENSTALLESLPLPVIDAKPSDFGSLTGAHSQPNTTSDEPAITQDASPLLPTLKLPEDPISVLPNHLEKGAMTASELSSETSSPNSTGNGADTSSSSSHSAREAENDNNSEKDGLELLSKEAGPHTVTKNDADTCLTSSCEVEGTESADHSDASELSNEAVSSTSTKNGADTPFASSPRASKDESGSQLEGSSNNNESDTHSASPPQAKEAQSVNSFMTTGNGGQALAKLSNLFFKTSAAAPAPSKTPPENAQIDTAAPFESVKQAVSKFGAIVDWKAHRSQTMERRKFIDHELAKVNEDIPLLKKQCEDADEAKVNVLKELDGTKRLIEELKLNLDRAQIEEQQAKQDSELALLRVEEIEQGITDDVSIAAKVQLEVAKARHLAAEDELRSVTAEMDQLLVDYSLLVCDRDAWVKKAEDAVSTSKEAEKTVEDLTIELISLKASLDAAHIAHMEAEEQRLGAAMAREQDILFWEKEVKQAEEELEKTNQQIESVKELKSNVDSASALLQDLKAELAGYMESKREADELPDEPERRTHFEMLAAAEAAKKELQEVKRNLEKTMDEVNCLRVAATSLKSELEKEKSEFSNVQQREGMASIAVASLEVELDRTKSDIAFAQMREKEARERLEELRRQLRETAREADLAKLVAETAREELRKAKEEAEQVGAAARTVESKLLAAQKEIEAAKASEKLAQAAMNALQESELAQSTNAPGVTVSLEEYYELSKKAHKAEVISKMRVAAAISRIEVAKESELKSLNRLEEVNSELADRKEGLRIALEKSDKAKKGKMAVEQELRKWRSEHMHKRKSSESHPTHTLRSGVEEKKESKPEKMDYASSIYHRFSPSGHKNPSNPKESSIVQDSDAKSDSSSEGKSSKKKKKAIIPRIFMFFNKKKVQSKFA